MRRKCGTGTNGKGDSRTAPHRAPHHDNLDLDLDLGLGTCGLPLDV